MRASITTHENPRGNIRRAGVWFGLMGGGIAWTIHLTSAYAIAEFGCVRAMGHRADGSISLVAWMELAATAVTVCLAAGATAAAYRSERRLAGLDAVESALIGEEYTARAGWLISGLFTFVIVFESIPILFYLRHC